MTQRVMMVLTGWMLRRVLWYLLICTLDVWQRPKDFKERLPLKSGTPVLYFHIFVATILTFLRSFDVTIQQCFEV